MFDITQEIGRLGVNEHTTKESYVVPIRWAASPSFLPSFDTNTQLRSDTLNEPMLGERVSYKPVCLGTRGRGGIEERDNAKLRFMARKEKKRSDQEYWNETKIDRLEDLGSNDTFNNNNNNNNNNKAVITRSKKLSSVCHDRKNSNQFKQTAVTFIIHVVNPFFFYELEIARKKEAFSRVPYLPYYYLEVRLHDPAVLVSRSLFLCKHHLKRRRLYRPYVRTYVCKYDIWFEIYRVSFLPPSGRGQAATAFQNSSSPVECVHCL